tara:strand:+ start:1276 stop:2220 length:945 start_codon:yes stop_codon:yes gene_type:complete
MYELLGIQDYENILFWLFLIVCFLIGIWISFFDPFGHPDVGPPSSFPLLGKFGFGLFLTWPVAAVLGIFLLPAFYVFDYFYTFENEIKMKWKKSTQIIENFCDSPSNDNLYDCLVKHSVRVNIAKYKAEQDYKEFTENLSYRLKDYNETPKPLLIYTDNNQNNNDLSIDSIFYSMCYTDEDYNEINPEDNYMCKDDYIELDDNPNQDEDSKYYLSLIADYKNKYYLFKNCGDSFCHLKISFYENDMKKKYITAFEIQEPKLREFETKNYLIDFHLEELNYREQEALNDIKNLEKEYSIPDIVKLVKLSLNTKYE